MGKKKRMQANGFEEWGGYMALKKQKLQEQFSESASKVGDQKTNLFHGIAIFVNGYTDPPADELRCLMMEHGGIYHHYYRTGLTTYVIASNLPDSKLKQTQGIKFLKPSWITESIKANKLLDYRDYLLYTNQSKTQPCLKFSSGKMNESSNSTKTATDKEFLSEFYSNSRLHHISTMGAVFKQYINDLRSNESHEFSGKDELLRSVSGNRAGRDQMGEDWEGGISKVVMHIDMDCFFVSVGLRDCPQLVGIPVAVTHAKGNRAQPSHAVREELELYRQKTGRTSQEGSCSHWSSSLTELDSMAEVASCSYEARAAGVKNGMFLGQALRLCPSLRPIPYDFEAYKEVSYTLYDTVARYTLDIEAVSCDEMYVDCTGILSTTGLTPLEFATILRNEIKEKTRCPCSVGFGSNKLQARIATRKAKPDGQYYLSSDVETFFRDIPVSDLPGVGHSTSYKLRSLGVKTCGDLQSIPLKKLQSDFGFKIGETLYKHCRGLDDKELVFNQVRKSVSAEVNYGIRFERDSERDTFLEQLSSEVADRLQALNLKGKSVTLKLMVRSKDAPKETAKFLGHGICDHITKSNLLPQAVSDSSTIFREVMKIIDKIQVDSKDLRGIGIQITRLEDCTKKSESNILTFFSKNADESSSKDNKRNDKNDVIRPEPLAVPSTSRAGMKTVSSTNLLNITLSQVDESFLSAVPEDIRAEILSALEANRRLKGRSGGGRAIPCPGAGPSQDDSLTSETDDNTSRGSLEEPPDSSEAVKSFVSPGELKNLLRQWVEDEESPLERDIAFVNNYLQELVSKCYLEELAVLLKYFFRFIQRSSKGDQWRTAYQVVLRDVQTKMKARFKGELALDDQFRSF